MKNPDVERNNPCLREQEATFKCFDDNNYNKKPCEPHMENYRTCKKFWGAVRSDRKKKGIRPYLPPLEEREQIKQEYLNKFNVNK